MYKAKALVQSTSMTVNGTAWVCLFFGGRDGSGMLYGNPIIVLQVTQWLIAFLTCWRLAGIQHLRRARFSVELAQAYNWLTCVSLMSNSVNGSSGGRRSKNLVDLETGALWTLLPRRITPLSSKKKSSCRTSCFLGVDLESMLEISSW